MKNTDDATTIKKWGKCFSWKSPQSKTTDCFFFKPHDNGKSGTVLHHLLHQNNTGEDTSGLFAVAQRCPEALLLPSLRQLCQWEERPRFCHRKIADNASVELNAALGEVVYEGRVLHAVLSWCCCNACDPERPHVALLEPATFSGVDESSPDRAHSQTVAAVLSASEVLRMFEDFLNFPVSVRSAASDPTRQRQEHHVCVSSKLTERRSRIKWPQSSPTCAEAPCYVSSAPHVVLRFTGTHRVRSIYTPRYPLPSRPGFTDTIKA